MSAKIISIVLGLVLIAVGAVGFLPNPIVSAAGLFEVDLAHNVVHIATGLLLLILPFIIGGKQSLLLIGVVYAAIAVLGLLHPTDSTLIAGQIAMNAADRYILHPAVAAVLLLAGLVFSNRTNE